MNAKKAKQLRKQSLKQAVASGLPYTDYGFTQYRKVFQSLDGKLHQYVVYNAFLKDCQRKILKSLKKEFKAGKA